MTLADYVVRHSERGECRCGQCIDKGDKPDPAGHVADLVFFPVAQKNGATVEEFTRLTRAHKGDWADCDPLDGKEHGYIELGGWIGDQGLAMQYMGLGVLLGVFNLLSPKMLGLPDDAVKQMAGMGMLSVIARAEWEVAGEGGGPLDEGHGDSERGER